MMNWVEKLAKAIEKEGEVIEEIAENIKRLTGA